MKRSTTLIIAIVTALLTVAGLNLAFGKTLHRHFGSRMGHSCHAQHRMGERPVTQPPSELANDSVNRR